MLIAYLIYGVILFAFFYIIGKDVKRRNDIINQMIEFNEESIKNGKKP